MKERPEYQSYHLGQGINPSKPKPLIEDGFLPEAHQLDSLQRIGPKGVYRIRPWVSRFLGRNSDLK